MTPITSTLDTSNAEKDLASLSAASQAVIEPRLPKIQKSACHQRSVDSVETSTRSKVSSSLLLPLVPSTSNGDQSPIRKIPASIVIKSLSTSRATEANKENTSSNPVSRRIILSGTYSSDIKKEPLFTPASTSTVPAQTDRPTASQRPTVSAPSSPSLLAGRMKLKKLFLLPFLLMSMLCIIEIFACTVGAMEGRRRCISVCH
ncbi:hypothetical protein PROFUN_01544 [Planoprotostelium fungivorum]|uniref:Uncharacterized protein n=1 Tax=Planoprotostelium fungivorum TaxID=1890364 RepID=A0A2P6NTJ4_9EUKA|nr:hypothetical protein PROFUN_01544 [Planoprotostelium fungivorum]